jgi:hypothetical protein
MPGTSENRVGRGRSSSSWQRHGESARTTPGEGLQPYPGVYESAVQDVN